VKASNYMEKGTHSQVNVLPFACQKELKKVLLYREHERNVVLALWRVQMNIQKIVILKN